MKASPLLHMLWSTASNVSEKLFEFESISTVWVLVVPSSSRLDNSLAMAVTARPKLKSVSGASATMNVC